ncbi:MAG: magnesium transporter [Nitrospirales bacterium]|nr:magnesium transporter [Nitrospira sp.]MDR4502186.1 magnesium transporter [Nitrospirales bacterium]
MTQAPTLSMHEAFISQYPEEAARVFESYPVEEILEILHEVSGRDIAKTVAAMTPAIAAEVLAAMPADMLQKALPEMDIAVVATLLRRLPEQQQQLVLDTVPESLSSEIRIFLDYPEDSVGLLMDPRFFALPQDLNIDEAIHQVRSRAPRDLHEIYIIDRDQTLTGILPLRDLFLAPQYERLQSLMKQELPTIHPLESQEQVVEVFDQWKVLTIPVTDLNGRLLGVIRNRDIIEVEKEEATIGMQTMVGASKDERALSPPMFAVRKRLPWLQINLLTAFLAAFVVGLFEDTIAQFTALAVLLPVVAGQSGNTGAQALAVVMRGLALRDIRPTQWVRVATKESYVAFVNGVAVAATTSAAVYIWSRSWGLTMVIAISMVMSMVMAGLSGAVIPIILRALNQDPAQSSSIILTTVTDVAGFLSFLGLATIFASLLE